MTIDVIIPLYKPGKELFTLLERLHAQSVPIRRIILLNTEEKYYEQLMRGRRFEEEDRNIEVHHLSKREFDHGGTRRLGVKKSQADLFVMMTQDAMPADEYLIERLTRPLMENEAQVSYARQLPREDCEAVERYTRDFNYPAQSRTKSAEDLQKLGVKTFFCSNVCAAYRRDVYEELGGFVRHTIFNEDMIYAAGLIQAGYSIAYVADAQVIHSHNYTNRQQFHRNFDLGVSQAQHPEIFEAYPSESEGKRMVADVTQYLWRNHMRGRLPHFYMQCACKYAGYLLGRRYRRLPMRLILKWTSNKEYWKQ